MGTSPPKKTTQTNEIKLSPEQQELAGLALPYAQQFAGTQLQLPEWQIAGFNPWEKLAQGMALGSTWQMSDLANQAAASNAFLMSPELLSPDSNPYLAAQGQAISQNMTQNLTESVLPALRSGATMAGGMYSGGSSREGIAQGLASGRNDQAIGQALTNLYSGAYGQGLSAMGQAIGQNPNVMRGLLYPSTVVSGVGGQIRGMEQAQLDAAAQNQWAQQQLPFLQAQQIYGLLNTLPGGQGVSTVQGAQPGVSPLSGALGGASIGTAIMPGIGTAAGAGIGALLSLL